MTRSGTNATTSGGAGTGTGTGTGSAKAPMVLVVDDHVEMANLVARLKSFGDRLSSELAGPPMQAHIGATAIALISESEGGR